MRSFFQSISLLILIALVVIAPASVVMAQRAVLVATDTGDRFPGSVVWRTEYVSTGAGQPPEHVVKARVDVPERKFAMTWTLQRNRNRVLPASHLIEMIFSLPDDNDAGGISEVQEIAMAPAEQRFGLAISGNWFKATGTVFLIGLFDGLEKDHLQKLGENGWLNIALRHNNNRRTFLHVEKGDAGTRAFNEAFAAWESQVTPPRRPENPPKASARASTGSGFLLTSSGHVVTNSHVVRDCNGIRVRAAGETIVSARLLAREDNDDLAVLNADLFSRRPDAAAKVRTTPSVRAGEAIVVFGFPLSGLLASTGNATIGNVTALAGLRNDHRRLQISAPVQPGSSGGPVLDMSGNVVGVVVSKLDALRVARVTADVPQNINFAVKSSTLVNFLDARGVPYAGGESRTDLSIPDIVERAKAMSVEVRCEK